MSLTSLHLFSEPYGSTGNMGENSSRLLGAPTLDPLQTVIRESLQNIADAARLGIGPEIQIRLRRLTAYQKAVLASRVLGDLPTAPGSRDGLVALLSQERPVVMEICDFRTVGLGGPTRADSIPVDTKQTEFINFVRNIGAARDVDLGGGTYGFGKVALYRASRCSTVIIDTLPHDSGPEGRRLIGCHIGPSFDVPQNGICRRFTGRHWWGIPDPADAIVDPLSGRGAAEMASALGFLPRDMNRTGTSIMILDFETDEEDLSTIGNRIVETILYNFWPRLMKDTPAERRFDCSVEVEGVAIEIPAPEDFPPLDLFTKAMRAARAGKGNSVRRISSQRPARELGTLAIEKGLRAPRRPLLPAEDSLFPPVAKHIALMRPVELVVKYLEGSALPDERLEWAGVFIASDKHEVERAFADSEPPAHDDWIPDNLPKGPGKTFVNVALRELRSHASQQGESAMGRPSNSQSGPPLAHLAGRLGAALQGVAGDGAGRKRKSTGSSGSRPIRARATPPLFVRLETTELGRVAVFSTVVRQDSRHSGAILTSVAAVAIEGSTANQLDADLQLSILSIRSTDGVRASEGGTLALQGSEGEFEIRVMMPSDCAVMVNADVLTE